MTERGSYGGRWGGKVPSSPANGRWGAARSAGAANGVGYGPQIKFGATDPGGASGWRRDGAMVLCSARDTRAPSSVIPAPCRGYLAASAPDAPSGLPAPAPRSVAPNLIWGPYPTLCAAPRVEWPTNARSQAARGVCAANNRRMGPKSSLGRRKESAKGGWEQFGALVPRSARYPRQGAGMTVAGTAVRGLGAGHVEIPAARRGYDGGGVRGWPGGAANGRWWAARGAGAANGVGFGPQIKFGATDPGASGRRRGGLGCCARRDTPVRARGRLRGKARV